jgi:DNA recombination protein RmuC
MWLGAGIAILMGWLFGYAFVRRQNKDTPPVSHDLYQASVAQCALLRNENGAKEQEIRTLLSQLAAKSQEIRHLQENLGAQKVEVQRLQQHFQQEFERVANRLLEEKSAHITDRNAQQMQAILLPLRERIQEFEANIDRKFLEEAREKSSLRKEIEQLGVWNSHLSQEAQQLTAALKGQSKIQGDWGELQLEVLLEKAGLSKGVHFVTQNTLRTDVGTSRRPDVVLYLPGDRHLVLDAKVSLTAYEQYYREEDTGRRAQFLKAHVASLRSHVEDLSAKNYANLPDLNTPDYVLLFVPLEAALQEATLSDSRLFSDALERNIIIVSNSTLLSTMRTVAHLWKQDRQHRSVQEIARQSGLLYDKLVAFVEDLKGVGARLGQAQDAYGAAMNKLTHAARPGDTLIGKAEKIKSLGARTSRNLPADLLAGAEDGDQPADLPRGDGL